MYSPAAKDPQKRLVYNQVIEMLNDGEAISHIAKENGITRQTVYRIKHALSN
nr:helix-turn-helix domain-containing protein [Bacillus thuringiensis]